LFLSSLMLSGVVSDLKLSTKIDPFKCFSWPTVPHCGPPSLNTFNQQLWHTVYSHLFKHQNLSKQLLYLLKPLSCNFCILIPQKRPTSHILHVLNPMDKSMSSLPIGRTCSPCYTWHNSLDQLFKISRVRQ